MTDLKQQQTILSDYFEQHLPHIANSGLRLDAISEDRLRMSIALSDSSNEMGQAFGTSIYTLCHMACWSSLYLQCLEHIDKPTILSRDAQIRFRHPVTSERVIADCRLPNATQWKGFFAHYRNTGKTSITLTSRIYCDERIDVYYDGVFVLLGESAE